LAKFFRQFYLHPRTYWVIAGIALILFSSYWFTPLYQVGLIIGYVTVIILVLDTIYLFRAKKGIAAKRNLPERFSNNDENEVRIFVQNNYPFKVEVFVLDELPVQLQIRDFGYQATIVPRETKEKSFNLVPKSRGEYHFGSLHIFVNSPIRFVKRRYSFQINQMVKVYPSFLQMRKVEFLTMNTLSPKSGLKRVRRIGHTMEFEQIKNYVAGDDVRSINWKSTAKSGDVMINQYQELKSQPIYVLMNVGRVMKMPFDGLSLLDYAINSTLAFCNIALKKGDKAGVVTFSNAIHHRIEAGKNPRHLQAISEMLYNIQTQHLESDFGLIFSWVKRNINQRSLLLLYTNFEHLNSLERQLPHLRALSKNHLLVVVIFENSILGEYSSKPVTTKSEIFQKTIFQKFLYDKKLMAKELNRHGIQTILCQPKDLTIHSINKYLELKSRSFI
jgi:uncharacterized protein (DUF58 family)